METKNKLTFNIFLIIAAFSLLINVGSYGVMESSDARYAEIGRAMYTSGDYLHPNLLDVHHYHKPPLTYQITAFGYQLFGVNSFGARFFLQLAILLQLILVYHTSKLLFNNKKKALWSAIIYLSFPLVLIASRSLTTDAFLATFALLNIYSWIRYRKDGDFKWLYAFSISAALGFLTKGPVLFIVPVIFIIFYNRVEKNKRSFSIHHLLALLVFLAISSYWFIYLGIQNAAFVDYFLGKHTADRFSKNAFGRTEPFYYFLILAPLVGLTWFFNLIPLIKIQKEKLKPKTIHFALLMAFVIPLIFFSISSSKRILYILPLYGLLSILVADLFSKIQTEKVKIINRITLSIYSLILVAFILLPFINTGMNFSYLLAIGSVLILISIFFIYKSEILEVKFKPILTTLLVTIFLIIGGTSVLSNNELKINSSKPITEFIINSDLNSRDILVYNIRKSSIAFGLNKSIISLYNGHKSLNRETQFETDLNWKNHLINLKDNNEVNHLRKIIEKPTVLLLYKKNLPENLNWLSKNYKNKEKIGKWTIYY